jgi:hypothetical protein
MSFLDYGYHINLPSAIAGAFPLRNEDVSLHQEMGLKN